MNEVISRNVDHAFDQYLIANETDMIKAMQDYDERIEKSSFKFGRFAIPSFFKPYILSHKQERLVKSVTESFVQILNKVVDLYSQEPAIQELFNLSPEAKELISIDPGYSQNIIAARFDCFIEGGSLKFIELNSGSPAGTAYADIVEEVLCETAGVSEFFKAHHVKRVSRSEHMLEALLAAYEQFGGQETPQIAIVDWRTVRTHPEFEALKKVFEAKGYKTTIADPRDLKYQNGKLYHADFRVDIIYRRVLFGELLERLDEVKDFIRAYKDKSVCVVNSLRSKLAGTKAVMSLLTNPGYDHFFTEEENIIKREHLPWTRQMLDAEKFYGGKKIYLVDFLKDEKESLVIKPAEAYGGKDVFIGCETPEEDWNRAIDRALKGDWVIQEFVSIPVMTVPKVVNNRIDFLYKKFNFSGFVFGDRYAGGFCRVSDESVITIARNGGMIASLSAEEVHSR